MSTSQTDIFFFTSFGKNQGEVGGKTSHHKTTVNFKTIPIIYNYFISHQCYQLHLPKLLDLNISSRQSKEKTYSTDALSPLRTVCRIQNLTLPTIGRKNMRCWSISPGIPVNLLHQMQRNICHLLRDKMHLMVWLAPPRSFRNDFGEMGKMEEDTNKKYWSRSVSCTMYLSFLEGFKAVVPKL